MEEYFKKVLQQGCIKPSTSPSLVAFTHVSTTETLSSAQLNILILFHQSHMPQNTNAFKLATEDTSGKSYLAFSNNQYKQCSCHLGLQCHCSSSHIPTARQLQAPGVEPCSQRAMSQLKKAFMTASVLKHLILTDHSQWMFQKHWMGCPLPVLQKAGPNYIPYL